MSAFPNGALSDAVGVWYQECMQGSFPSSFPFSVVELVKVLTENDKWPCKASDALVRPLETLANAVAKDESVSIGKKRRAVRTIHSYLHKCFKQSTRREEVLASNLAAVLALPDDVFSTSQTIQYLMTLMCFLRDDETVGTEVISAALIRLGNCLTSCEVDFGEKLDRVALAAANVIGFNHEAYLDFTELKLSWVFRMLGGDVLEWGDHVLILMRHLCQCGRLNAVIRAWESVVQLRLEQPRRWMFTKQKCDLAILDIGKHLKLFTATPLVPRLSFLQFLHMGASRSSFRHVFLCFIREALQASASASDGEEPLFLLDLYLAVGPDFQWEVVPYAMRQLVHSKYRYVPESAWPQPLRDFVAIVDNQWSDQQTTLHVMLQSLGIVRSAAGEPLLHALSRRLTDFWAKMTREYTRRSWIYMCIRVGHAGQMNLVT